MEAGNSQSGCLHSTAQSLGALRWPRVQTQLFTHPGLVGAQAQGREDAPTGALTAVNLSGPSQGQASRCLETCHQGNNGQMAKNGRGSLLSLGGPSYHSSGLASSGLDVPVGIPGPSLVLPPSVSKCPMLTSPSKQSSALGLRKDLPP